MSCCSTRHQPGGLAWWNTQTELKATPTTRVVGVRIPSVFSLLFYHIEVFLGVLCVETVDVLVYDLSYVHVFRDVWRGEIQGVLDSLFEPV